jgi:hypothetical protein
MDKRDTARIMAIIYEAYHFFYKDSTDQKITTAINLWHNMFQVESYELVEAAVYAHISKSEHPPTVAHIKKEINFLADPYQMTETEAMNAILLAASNSLYNAAEEFEKLPTTLQKLVGSPRQLRDYALMDSKTMNSVIASNLSKSYKILINRENSLKSLPALTKLYLEKQ